LNIFEKTAVDWAQLVLNTEYSFTVIYIKKECLVCKQSMMENSSQVLQCAWKTASGGEPRFHANALC